MSKTVLVTGGTGFIGSHTSLVLLDYGYSVVIIDNLENSKFEAFRRLKELAGDKKDRLKFVEGDLRDFATLDKVFSDTSFTAVIHFAARKYVNESVEDPVRYYDHNVVGTVNLVKAMQKHGVKSIVFSSSCTVYGVPQRVPIDETHPLSAVNPYGRTKIINEDIFRDLANADKDWRIVLLRYFNPVGAHPSGRIGEDQVLLNNLMPWVQAVALGHKPELAVYGTDYDTADGTCVRDYIHVMDLADGHVKAVQKIEATPGLGAVAYNLGTGKGTTVLEMVHAFEAASGLTVKTKLVGRRPGDAPAVWAATDTAERELGWTGKRTVEDMCADQWRWASQNPDGYDTKDTAAKDV